MKKWFKKRGALLIIAALFVIMIVLIFLLAQNQGVALPGQGSTPPSTNPSVSQPSLIPDVDPPITDDPVSDTKHYMSLGMFKKFGIVGDSYTLGTVYVLNDDGTFKSVGCYDDLAWGNIMAKKLGTQCSNFSGGGLSTRTWLSDYRGLNALLAAEPQNIYYLMLGINDKETYGRDGIGSLADIKDDFTQNADTFYGNYGKIICHIKAHAPEAKLIISTMTGTTATNKLYNDAIEEIAAYFGIPCVKQYECSFFKTPFYLDNLVGSHPTAPLYAGMAEALEELFEKAVIDNYDYFKDYIG